MAENGGVYHTFDKTPDSPGHDETRLRTIKKDAAGLNKDDVTYTTEDAIEAIGFGRFQVKLSFIAGLAWIADSMELMVLSILGPVLLCEWQLSTTKEAMITTVVFLGFTIGSPIMGWIADCYGRKTSLMLAASWGAFYGILSCVSPIYPWLLILRGLTGVGLAGVPQAVTYYSEFLPSKYRGKCIVLLEVFWALGALLEVTLAIIILQPFGWRWWLLASAAPLLIFVPSCLAFPESPRFLMACGRYDDAKATLEYVAKENNSQLPPGKLQPEAEMRRARLSDLFTPEYRRSTVLLWIVWFIATFSYYGIVLLSTELIQAGTTCAKDGGLPLSSNEGTCQAGCVGLTPHNYVELLWTSAAELPGLLLTVLYVDYMGRKTAMALNFVLFAVVMFLLFICANNVFIVAMLFVGRALIASALQIAFVYTPELYPTTVRALGIGTCNVFARIGAIITPFVSEVLVHVSLMATLSIYGCLGLIAAIVVMCLPIETRGRTLQTGKH